MRGAAICLLVTGCVPRPEADPAMAAEPIEPSAADDATADDPLGDPKAADCLERAPASDCGGVPCAARCRKRDWDACHTLAGAHEQACRTRLWEIVCAEGHLASCAALGEALQDEQPKRSAELLRRACDQRHGPACTALGEHPLTHATDALGLFERACERGDGLGCWKAAALHSQGVSTAVDPERAANLLERSCELDHLAGCLELAQVYRLGRGAPRDEERAVALLERLCHRDALDTEGRACLALGRILEQANARRSHAGQGPSLGDPQTAFERGCDKGLFDACTKVALARYAAGDYPETIALASKLVGQRPEHWVPRYTRGLSLFKLGHFSRAEQDFEALCPNVPNWPHCHLFLFAARARLGEDGSAALREARRDAPDRWPRPIMDFYLGKLEKAELVREARHDDEETERKQLCEAYYYIGQRQLARGERHAARRMFERTVDTGVTDFIEYAGAKAELSRMP